MENGLRPSHLLHNCCLTFLCRRAYVLCDRTDCNKTKDFEFERAENAIKAEARKSFWFAFGPQQFHVISTEHKIPYVALNVGQVTLTLMWGSSRLEIAYPSAVVKRQR